MTIKKHIISGLLYAVFLFGFLSLLDYTSDEGFTNKGTWGNVFTAVGAAVCFQVIMAVSQKKKEEKAKES